MVLFFQASIAGSTASTYQTGWRNYQWFCRDTNIAMLPLNQWVLQCFVTWLARRISYKSIKVYLTGVQYFSTIIGYPERILHMHRLFYLLRGIRRQQGTQFRRPRRTPITISHLQLLLAHIKDGIHSVADKAMLRSAVTLAFFGLLRVSEFVSQAESQYDPESTLLVSDVSITQDVQLAKITIKKSKTDPFKEGCIIRIAATYSDICPVRALFQLIRVHPSMQGPPFTYQNGSYLTRSKLVQLLRLALPDAPNVNTHSFRIGGASAAASAGLSDSQIQLIGRWSSDSYKRYIRVSDESICRFMFRMSRVSHFSSVWDTDLCTAIPIIRT